MSIRVMTRVWDYADASGGELLVLLALADFAEDSGICYPIVATVAKKARLSERQAHRVLSDLTARGEVATIPGGGRGKPTRYAVLSGLDAATRTKTLTKLQGLTKSVKTSGISEKGCQNNSETAISVSGVLMPTDDPIRHGGDLNQNPPPPTPATASPGGGGLAPPSEPEPPQPEPHPETLHALTALKITPVVRRELALIAPDVVARTIRACQKIPGARNVAALVVKHLREYLATGDELAPAGACTPTPNDPPPLPDAPTRSADERRALIAARRQERPREIGAL